jgi:hypothetical protein
MSVWYHAIFAFALIASEGCVGSNAQVQSRGSKNGEIIEDWGVTQYHLSDKALFRLGLHSTSSKDDVRGALLRFNIDITKDGAATIFESGSSILVKSFDAQRKQVSALIDKLEKEE